MRDIRDCSGPWKGTWDQRAVRGTMAFSLLFVGDLVTGGGTDRDGPFTMTGEVDGDAIFLVKSYPWLDVRYDGRWNGSFVAGRSTIGPLAHGEFGSYEMWPEDEETAIESGASLQEAPLALGATGSLPLDRRQHVRQNLRLPNLRHPLERRNVQKPHPLIREPADRPVGGVVAQVAPRVQARP